MGASKPRREFLQSRLQGRFAGIAQSLAADCDRFAACQWNNLSNVTRDLLRMQDALRHATAGLRTSGLASQDGVLAQTFLTVVQCDLFWTQCHALRALAKPMVDFYSWVRACCCHEAQCLAQEEVRCKWKGCRAPELSQRVRLFAADLLALRETHALQEGAHPHVGRGPIEVRVGV